MAVKKTTFGQQRIVPKGVILRLYSHPSGSLFDTVTRTAASPYNRRIGTSSTISYQTGRDGRFRPCSHSKDRYFARPLTMFPPSLYGFNGMHSSYCFNLAEQVHAQRYSNFIVGAAAAGINLAATQWNALAAEALSTMLPSFSGKNSLMNFLLELKDFKSIVKYLKRGIDDKLTLLNSLTGIHKKDKTFKKLSKSYLSYSFGWKPLFNDIVSFAQAMSDFHTRLRDMVQRANTPQQSYWGTWISGTSLPENIYYSTSGGGDGPIGGWIGPSTAKYRLRVIQEATSGVRFHATVRYRYPLPPELIGVEGQAKAWLDVLGFNGNPAILWNAIPFSFIVDWLVDVSGWLNRLRVENIHFKTEILDFCTSAKMERNIRCEMGFQYNPQRSQAILLSPWFVTDVCTRTQYERRLGLPNFLQAMKTSGLNEREFSLAGALVGANTRRRR